MHLRSVAATLALLVLASPVVAQPDPLRDRFATRLEDTGGDEATRQPFARVWDVMDSVVLRELRRGREADEVNRALAQFPAYSGASEGDGVPIGRGTFYSELPRALPSYVVLPVRAGGETLLMGVYNFGINGAGRISLFAKRTGTWRRTAAFDARFPVVPYLLPLADSGLAVVTLETFTGGDHQDGTARVWRIRRGALEPLLRLPGEMKEPSARVEKGNVEIAFTRFPRHLSAPILGTRLGYVTTIRALGTRVTTSTESANPWVDVVDRYYGLAATSPAAARALLADPALARPLGTRPPMSLDDGGDARAGSGWIEVERNDMRHRIIARRGAGGRWRITAVEAKRE
jgi:hypothetical protein